MKRVEIMKRDRKNAGNYNVYSKSVRMLENIEWMFMVLITGGAPHLLF